MNFSRNSNQKGMGIVNPTTIHLSQTASSVSILDYGMRYVQLVMLANTYGSFNIICDLGYNMGQLQSRVKRKRKKLSTSTEAVNWEQVSTRQQQLEWHVTILPSFKGTHTTPERVRKQAPVAAIDETSSVEISASTGEQEADLSSSQDRHETVTEGTNF
jgi:hypothetical protein